MNIRLALNETAGNRVLILDGAMGTMIQKFGLSEEDFRGSQFRDHPVPLLGCNDLLCLTKGELISSIHEDYLRAGADIIETCSFNANALSLDDYGLADKAYDISFAAALLAKKAARAFSDAAKPRFVAGVLGPTARSGSISPDMNDPGKRAVSWDELESAYYDNARGLLDGGADILMIETVFDTLNAKAAVAAVSRLLEERTIDVPLMISATVSDAAGRLLSGQTVEAFCVSVMHGRPWSLGLNCSFGAEKLKPHLRALSAFAPVPLSCHPNAGMPNRFGEYDESPESMALYIDEFLKEGLVNIVGGCCGTTPEHIAAIASAAAGYKPRRIPHIPPKTRLSGLEALPVEHGQGLTGIGERTNVAGSRKFLRLIKEKKYGEALSIARDMAAQGAALIDICMDDALLDAESEMVNFVNLALSDPDIAALPFMIDSSRWEVIEAALKCIQGKSLVNSISLKEGEAEFLRRAHLARHCGAAVVVMLFDEQGQAADYERKIAVAERSYRLLTGNGFPPEDIIFDPNVLSIATGIPEHDRYALDFIRACKKISELCPHSQISGGISNLSFSFRGNEVVRQAMHAVFLKHAAENGLSMAIVNPAALLSYDEIDPELREAAEDLILCRDGGTEPGEAASDSSVRRTPAERMLSLALKIREQERNGAEPSAGTEKKDHDARRQASPEERLIHSIVRGIDDFIDADVTEIIPKYKKALDIVEGPLMDGMKEVGRRFGEGDMFLPQVIRSARVMKKAVAVLQPAMEAEKKAAAGGREREKIVLATVKGDVHDIGKNIVGVVLGCSGYDIIDLGVMIPAEEIIGAAEREGAKAIGLSGLITPSLEEMIRTARRMEERRLSIPLLIGGATASLAHTALRIAPEYSGPVVYVPDASRSAEAVRSLLSETDRPAFLEKLGREYEEAAKRHEKTQESAETIPLECARDNRVRFDWEADLRGGNGIIRPRAAEETAAKNIISFKDYSIAQLIPFINWDAFFNAWDMGKNTDSGAINGAESERLKKARDALYEDAQRLLEEIISKQILHLNGTIGFFPAWAEDDDIVLFSNLAEARASGDKKNGMGTELARFSFLRNQNKKRGGAPNPCLADFILPKELALSKGKHDWLGLFVLSAGFGMDSAAEQLKKEQDDYTALLLGLLADRLTEAFSEALHQKVRREYWAYSPEEALSPAEILQGKYRGIRPGFGYPLCPDHHDKKTALALLDAERRNGFALTPSSMIIPASSVCGMYFAHPGSYYFGMGQIGRDQLEDWAKRKGISAEEAEKRSGKI